jgi:hypothetical protein
MEIHGDVATVCSNGSIFAEEDKSSIRTNPVTDKSVELWKTLSNWVDAVQSGELDPALTTFILYKNRRGLKGLAEVFSSANTRAEAMASVAQATKKLASITAAHEIWPFYKNAVMDNKEVLVEIIQKFILDSGDGAGYGDVEKEVVKKHVPLSQIKTLVANINGWLVRLVAERISANLGARISWEEFDCEFKVHFSRARRLELIDFALISPPSDVDIDLHINVRPTFLRQIELINGSDDEIFDAVNDYLRAKINRQRWIEDELIDEQLAAGFEESLTQFWLNANKKVAITNRTLSKEDCGQLLLSECLVRQEMLRGEHPPRCTIAGTYHALADRPTLGWHADWKGTFKK